MTEPASSPDARIEAALARLHAGASPPSGWQERVLREALTPPPSPWWRIARIARIAAPAFAAAALIAFALWPRPDGPAGPYAVELAMAHQPAEPTRGEQVTAGDMVALGTVTGAPYRALWIVHDEQTVVVACPGDPGCLDLGYLLVVIRRMPLIGEYRVFALASDSPISRPTEPPDRAVARAVRAGAELREDKLQVR